MSRGLGRWQRVILDRLRHEHVICVNDVVVANVLNPSRADFVAARRGAATLASAGRVGTGRITLCSDIGCRDGGGDGHRPLCRGAFTEYLFVATITWSELLWAPKCCLGRGTRRGNTYRAGQARGSARTPLDSRIVTAVVNGSGSRVVQAGGTCSGRVGGTVIAGYAANGATG